MVNPLVITSLGATGIKAFSEFLVEHPGFRRYWSRVRKPTIIGSILGGTGGFIAGVKEFGEKHLTDNPDIEMATTDGLTMLGMNPIAAAASGATIGFTLPAVILAVAGIEAHSHYTNQGSWVQKRYKNIFPVDSYWDKIWRGHGV